MSERYPHSTIQCLGAIAQHHRLPVHPERLIEDYALPAEEPSAATLLRIAGEIGLKARHDTLTWEQLLGHGSAKLHLYGKSQARPGRKMGHVTVLGTTLTEALASAASIRALIAP